MSAGTPRMFAASAPGSASRPAHPGTAVKSALDNNDNKNNNNDNNNNNNTNTNHNNNDNDNNSGRRRMIMIIVRICLVKALRNPVASFAK